MMLWLPVLYGVLLFVLLPFSLWLDYREKRGHHPSEDLREVYRERTPGAEALRRARGER